MKKLVLLFILVPLLGLSSCTTALKEESSSIYSTPEREGLSSSAILKLVNALEEAQPDALHSIMLRRNGKIVAQGWWAPYNPDSRHLLWSLSKSFTSTAIGIAQDEGLLSINDQVISFFPEDLPGEVSNNLKSMRISDLLRMNTGHEQEPSFRQMQNDNWVEAFLAHEVKHKPGTHFRYNSMATYMCSAILQKVSGQTLLEYLTPRLFEPLGIKEPTWESDPRGINVGGWGLSVTTEDISKLGQLYLQKGMWEGKQLLSQAWVEEATSLRTSNGSNPESDWDQGYGYQFWQCRHNAYRGDGAFGQYCIVMPEQNAVLAITAGSNDLQGILNLVWEHLLPAFKENLLPPDQEGLDNLTTKLQSLAISTVEGEESSPMASEVSGQSYSLAPNESKLSSIFFDFDKASPRITIISEQGEESIEAAYEQNILGSLSNPYLVSRKVAVSGAWTASDTYAVKVIYYESPQSVIHTFRFEENRLFWDTENIAAFAPGKQQQITGTY
jgi:CubicO group peptidase (beta-lactamase class C family)